MEYRAAVKQNGDIVQVQDYYAFGLEMSPGNTLSPSPANQYKYNGKEKQVEMGLDQYDYGARFYDPVIGRFNVIDRFAEKYVDMSPYQYAGNNPVTNVDVNGDSIKVDTKISINLTSVGLGKIKLNTSVYYKGGQAYYKNGKEYDGDDQFVTKVGTALKELSSKAIGKGLVDDLESSTRTVKIFNSTGSRSTRSGEDFISWNSTDDGRLVPQELSKPKRPSFVSLGHEMAHVQDTWRGTVDRSKWYNSLDENGDVNGFITQAEKYASHIENQIRAEHNIPLRTHYSPLRGGGVYWPSQLIYKKKKMVYSLFYFQANPISIISPYRYR